MQAPRIPVIAVTYDSDARIAHKFDYFSYNNVHINMS